MKLFSLRDDLFEFVKDSELTFESDAHRNLRAKINLTIYNANQIRFTEIIRHIALFKFFPHYFKNYQPSHLVIKNAEDFDSAYKNETEKRLLLYEEKLIELIGVHIIKSYPIALLFLKKIVDSLRIFINYIYQGNFESNKTTKNIGRKVYNSYAQEQGENFVVH